jgi:hypothetical protein
MTFLVATLVLQAVPVQVNPSGSSPQETPTVACDPSGCAVAWSQDRMTAVKWLYADGGEGPQSMTGVYATIVDGVGAWGPRRFYLETGAGIGGDYSLNIQFTPQTGAPIDSTGRTNIDTNIFHNDVGAVSFAPGTHSVCSCTSATT